MAIGDDTDDSDDRLLVPLSENLVRKLDTARGDQSYSEYLNTVLDRARQQTETQLNDQGTVVGETAAISEPGEATTEDEFEQYWHSQMRTVFAWLWVGVVAMYGAADLISTYFVIRTGAGFEANPLVAGLIDISPALVVIWKAVAVFILFYLAEALLRQADHTRIPWVALIIPAGLVIWGSFVTGMNFMNIPSEAQLISAVSITSAVLTVIIGYLLLGMVYEEFVGEQDEYPGFAAAPWMWLLGRPSVPRLRVDSTARALARDLTFPAMLVLVSVVIAGMVAVLPSGHEFRELLLRPTRYADLLILLTVLIVGGTGLQALARRQATPGLAALALVVRRILAVGLMLTILVAMLLLASLTSSRGTGLLDSIRDDWLAVMSWLGDTLGPLSTPGSFYLNNSPLGASIWDVAIAMFVLGLLVSIPLAVMLARRTRNKHPLA